MGENKKQLLVMRHEEAETGLSEGELEACTGSIGLVINSRMGQ